MVTNIQSTELDFNSIKQSLKTFLAQKEEFKDYDFEGSGLSNILDVLAYNTHFNALTANMAINESFLETAQLRSSVITNAQSLGYFPRSYTSSSATVQLSLDLTTFSGTPPISITLPAGTLFTSVVENVSYTFQTLQAYTAENDGFDLYIFGDDDGNLESKLYEGVRKTQTFFVPRPEEKRIYVIGDEALDKNTIEVSVYDNSSSTNSVTYSNITEAIRIDSNTRFYLLREAANGFYELQFGVDNSFGQEPVTGNKIEVSYLTTNGEAPNGALSFSAQNSVTVGAQSFPLAVGVLSVATGGSEKESIESIRTLAPLNFASQRRMVTKEDYRALILANYSSVRDANTWGGEENDPVDYGKIYISLKFEDDIDNDSKETVKSDITKNLIAPLGTMSIDPVYVDPTTTYLGITTLFDYNPNLSSLTPRASATAIENEVVNYFDENLEIFGNSFRRSALLSRIDDLNEAILSSSMIVELNQRLELDLNVSKSYSLTFPVEIATPDDVNYRINTSRFIFDSKTCRIKNKLNSYTLQIVNEADEVIERNIGTYDNNGTINIIDLNASSILNSLDYIKVFATPANQATIRPGKNYILELDTDNNNAIFNIDYQKNRKIL